MLKYWLGAALILTMTVIFFLASCTVSLQNISTHGTATDLVDENMDTSPNINPVISVPLNPM